MYCILCNRSSSTTETHNTMVECFCKTSLKVKICQIDHRIYQYRYESTVRGTGIYSPQLQQSAIPISSIHTTGSIFIGSQTSVS
jgi:hypothetical protein